MCLQWLSYETGVEKQLGAVEGMARSRHTLRVLEVGCLSPVFFLPKVFCVPGRKFVDLDAS